MRRGAPLVLALLSAGTVGAVRLGSGRARVGGSAEDALGREVDRAVHAAVPRARWRQRSRARPEAPSLNRAAEWHGPLWFFAAHHKAGTNLLHDLAAIQASALNLLLCTGTCGLNFDFGKPCELDETSVSERTMFYCNTGVGEMDAARKVAKGHLRAVHIIRDPVALVVSGYVYDMHNNDGFHASRSMRRKNTTAGIAMEAEFMLKDVLPTMLAVHRNGQASGDTLVLRMEEFLESSESFDETVARLYNFTLGDFAGAGLLQKVCSMATKEDLRRHPEPEGVSAVSPAHLKRQAEAALERIPADLLAKLHKYRRDLGYTDS